MASLTKTFIDDVPAPEAGYKIHWHDTIKGYGLRVTENGRKTFVAQGRAGCASLCDHRCLWRLYPQDRRGRRAQGAPTDARGCGPARSPPTPEGRRQRAYAARACRRVHGPPRVDDGVEQGADRAAHHHDV